MRIFNITGSSCAAGRSKISGELLEDIEYSHIGSNPFKPRESMIQSKFVARTERLSEETLRAIQSDWEEVCLDFTQLGLTVVGLIEVAEPVQIAADLTNGGIDISRGHPYIGALSIASATPLAGLVTGIILTGLRVFKCIFTSLKVLGRCFIVLATKAVSNTMKFIYLHRGVILNYCQNAKRFLMNTGEKIIEGFPKVTEKILKNIKDFGEQMAKQRATQNYVTHQSAKTSTSALEESLKTPFKRSNPYNMISREIDVYSKYPPTQLYRPLNVNPR